MDEQPWGLPVELGGVWAVPSDVVGEAVDVVRETTGHDAPQALLLLDAIVPLILGSVELGLVRKYGTTNQTEGNGYENH